MVVQITPFTFSYKVLEYLFYKRDWCAPKELRKAIGLSAPYFTKVSKKLLKEDLINKKGRGPNTQIILTPKGKERYAQANVETPLFEKIIAVPVKDIRFPSEKLSPNVSPKLQKCKGCGVWFQVKETEKHIHYHSEECWRNNTGGKKHVK